ncbi:hypothetical protein ACP70R_007869 [Stipagrostis hirtigluma subsp. patula]
MALATGVIGTLLPKLHELSEEAIDLPRSVRGEIMFLIAELESMQGALRRVWSEKPAEQLGEQDKLWNKHATELSQGIDGLVDNFRRSNISSGRRSSNRAVVPPSDLIAKIHWKLSTAKDRREFVGGIRDATRLVKELVERHGRYRIDSTVLPPKHLPDLDESRVAVAVEFPKDDNLRKLKLSSRAQADIVFLKTEMETVQFVLRELAKVPVAHLDEGTRAWAEDLREVSCDIKHAVDNFNKATTVKARHRFATDISDLKDCFLQAAERRQRYDLSGLRVYRRTAADNASRQDPEKLVAIDGPRDELVKLLKGEESTSDRKLKLASIIGIAGVGKTALAKEVYSILKPEFKCTAWVSLPTQPDMKVVLQDLLHQISQREGQHGGLEAMGGQGQRGGSLEAALEALGGQGQRGAPPPMDEKDIIGKIRDILWNKRYFIVVEDISDLAAWNTMKSALFGNNNGSAVLTTSRQFEIAEDVGHVCRLRPLSPDDSRKLLYGRLFRSGHVWSPEQVEICEKFIAKCSGIPLAINSAACLLTCKPWTVKDWYALHDQNGNTLDRSYNDLPHHLKPCLLYLSMFQKGYEISGERLVWGWIAEGFIPETRGKTLQEVGESYLCDLTERKLIEPVEVDACGKVLSCRVYDMVHDLIISKSIEEKFAIILDIGQATSLPEKVQRLSIHGHSVDHPLPQIPLSEVRSLVVSGDANLMPSLSDFKELRALDLSGCDFMQKDRLKGIENSFLLKYLVIGGNCITGIPKEIMNLKLLQTLDLRASGLNELPESIFQIKRLERLCVSSHMKIPDGIGKMEGLQELFDINISKPELLKELCTLVKLRVLRIAIWSWDECLKGSAKQLQDNLCSLVQLRENIQSLSIYTCYSLDFMNQLDNDWASPSLKIFEIRYSPFSTLPIWMQSLHTLSSLSIEVYKLSKEIIGMLGKLRTLNSLSLTSKHAAEPDGKFGIDTDGFKNLTSFHLLSNAMTEIFAPKPEAMQMLKRVKLSFQASRTADVNQYFRFGLEQLCSLEHVNIEITCFNASHQMVQNAEEAIREAISRGRSRQPNLEVRRIREKDMVEEGVHNITEQEQHKEEPNKKEDESCSTEVPTEGVRKYKIVSLDLESQILTLQPI